ncbi:MAG: PQQ-binding-like beta-propeller repeat protein [Dehalococcoidia bacterium]
MFAAAGCIGFNNPEGWAGPTEAGDLLVVSIDKGELSALDPNPESGPQCDNTTDDDDDGWVNEGCPRVGAKAESREQCDNDTNDDKANGVADDDMVNDGCPLSPQWTFPTGDEEPELDLEAIYGTPIVSGATVYFAAYNGDVYALDLESGEPLWDQPFDTDSAIIAGIALDDTALYVADDDGLLHVLDPQTGLQVNVFDAGDSIWAAPLLAEGVLYVASVNGLLYALDAETLEPIWDEPFETGHGLISDPVLADGIVLVGGIDRELHAVDAESGVEVWSFAADNWFWGRPLVMEGTAYAPNLDGRLYAIRLTDGAPVWNSPFEALEPLRSAPVLAGDTLVIADRKGNVYGLDPETGDRKWSNSESEGIEKTVLANPLTLNGEVLISAEGGDLFRLDPVAGSFDEVETR